MNKRLGLLLSLALAGLVPGSRALAHITIDSHTSRTSDQKSAPCGGEGTAWGAGKVYEFEPGQTLEIIVNEYVAHPGYFRVAFSTAEGKDFKDPISIQPIETTRMNQGSRDMDKGSDFCNDETVLMDNLDAHPTGPKAIYKYSVTLPSVECEKCTLQIIQVMEDTIHGPYNVEPQLLSLDLPDLYHQCVDFKLKGKASGERAACMCGEMVDGQKDDPNAKDGRCKGDTPSGEMPPESDASAQSDDSDAGAGEDHSDDGEIGEHEHETDDAPKDAGKTSAKDAGKSTTTKRDASSASDESPSTSGSSDGCSLQRADGALSWALLALGLFLTRRHRTAA